MSYKDLLLDGWNNGFFPGGGAVATVAGVAPDGGGDVEKAPLEAALTDLATTAALASAVANVAPQYVTGPKPSGGDDTAAINTALAVGTTVVLWPGTYLIAGHVTIANGEDMIGAGGGAVTGGAQTTIKCTAAAAQVEYAGGGSLSGDFLIDGNLTATTPFKRSGGAGANNRVFRKLNVINNAVSGTNSNPLALFYGAQNDSWYDCGFAGADGDARVFDQGYGGANFSNCKVNTAGGYGDHYNNAVAGGVFAQPTDINHFGGIIEGNIGAGCIRVDAGQLIDYYSPTLFSNTATSGAMVDVETGNNSLRLTDPYLQSTPATQVGGTVGLRVTGTSRIIVTGEASFYNFATSAVVDGVVATIENSANWFQSNCGATASGTNAGNIGAQIVKHFPGQTAWAAPAPGNGAQQAGSSVLGYIKNAAGMVQIRGVLTGVVAGNTAIMTLPVGMRPAAVKYFPIFTLTGGAVVTFGYARVDTAGVLTMQSGAGGVASFDGIAYLAEA